MATRAAKPLAGGASDRFDVIESFAANVRAHRRRLGLTQAELAEAAEMETRHLQRTESGQVDVGITTLIRLAEALAVEPGQLLLPAKLPPRAPGRPRTKKQSS